MAARHPTADAYAAAMPDRTPVLRMSTMFLRTLREDPAEAEVPSHRLLVRAGYIRRAASGGYTLMPLGKLVVDRIADVIHDEMRAIGGQQVQFPSLLPREPYEASGRWTEYGQEIFRLKDRRGADHLLAPTHEELFTLLVKDICASYRDYPVILYQMQTKFRDEPRPRAGLLRTREFIMKDAYSFDLDDDGQRASYLAHRGAYQRIFDRLGLRYTIVSAMSGAMGGSASEEFLADAEVGEDTYVACPSVRLLGEHRGGDDTRAAGIRSVAPSRRSRCSTRRIRRRSSRSSRWSTRSGPAAGTTGGPRTR